MFVFSLENWRANRCFLLVVMLIVGQWVCVCSRRRYANVSEPWSSTFFPPHTLKWVGFLSKKCVTMVKQFNLGIIFCPFRFPLLVCAACILLAFVWLLKASLWSVNFCTLSQRDYLQFKQRFTLVIEQRWEEKSPNQPNETAWMTVSTPSVCLHICSTGIHFLGEERNLLIYFSMQAAQFFSA